jgi:hypothetical protein
VTELESSPPVPPWDPGGDERWGYLIAGGLLLVLGWGLGVAANVVLHLAHPSPVLDGVRIGRTLGPYAWGLLGLGLFTGAIGAVLVGYARRSRRGPLILPGYPYDREGLEPAGPR